MAMVNPIQTPAEKILPMASHELKSIMQKAMNPKFLIERILLMILLFNKCNSYAIM
jgi:hypothetical protein